MDSDNDSPCNQVDECETFMIELQAELLELVVHIFNNFVDVIQDSPDNVEIQI